MSPFNSNEVKELLLESVVLVCIVNVHSQQLWGVHVHTPGEGGRKSNISEHHCSTNRRENDAAHLETKQTKTRNVCEKQNNGVRLKQRQRLLVCGAERRRTWLCAERWGNSCVAWWRRGAEILHCQSIPWARIRVFFDKAPLFAVTLLRWTENADAFKGQQRSRLREPSNKTTVEPLFWVSVVGRQNEWICLHTLCRDTVVFLLLLFLFLWVVCVFANVDRLSFVPGLGSNFCQSFCWSLLKCCTAGPIAQDHQLHRFRHLWTKWDIKNPSGVSGTMKNVYFTS